VDALELPALAYGIHRVIGFVPRLLVAAVIVAVAVGVGNLVLSLLASFSVSWFGRAARALVLVLGAFMALDEIGIARDIVIMAFSLVLGACAVAVAIAFGIGGRDTAKRYLEKWGQEAEQAARETRARIPPPREPQPPGLQH
jgi:hypothetical protein